MNVLSDHNERPSLFVLGDHSWRGACQYGFVLYGELFLSVGSFITV